MVWKQLTGEEVSWSKDFPAVDSVLVSSFETFWHCAPATDDSDISYTKYRHYRCHLEVFATRPQTQTSKAILICVCSVNHR